MLSSRELMQHFVRASKENPFAATGQIINKGDKLRISISRNRNVSDISSKVSDTQKSTWAKYTNSKFTAGGLRKIKLPSHSKSYFLKKKTEHR